MLEAAFATQRVVILVGLPGSGKSTWTAGQKCTPISSDELRRWLRDDATDQTIHHIVFRLMRDFLRLRIELGAPLTIVDATNLLRKHRRPFIKIAEFYGCAVEAVWFDTPVEECIRRNALRGRRVPESAIAAMEARLQRPVFEEGFRAITVVSTDGAQTTMPPPESASPTP